MKLEVGDTVKLLWTTEAPDTLATLVRKPQGPGDLWQFQYTADDGTERLIVLNPYAPTFEGFVKVSE